ncbi:ubiquinol-cytochrome c reductase iron-sulfur subunit [Massilia glaciei]|uniref:ubiquinol-cytochrome c reductase iron-sulfur subunit n=1 Tax=Massilia glaciei TaxID=1524097 RepID=UPI001E54E997|nr:ubiquinol-cytochrome c reductase iron-sulfur subunit [Massilia glaciei]
MDQTPHMKRRKFLTITTIGVGGIGLVATAIPFVASLTPSERARAAGAPVELDVAGMAPGALATIEWRGRPIFVLHRSAPMLASLAGHDPALADPLSAQSEQPPYASNPVRAVRPPFLVLTAICTHLGCIPSFRPEPGAGAGLGLGPDWPGACSATCPRRPTWRCRRTPGSARPNC